MSRLIKFQCDISTILSKFVQIILTHHDMDLLARYAVAVNFANM